MPICGPWSGYWFVFPIIGFALMLTLIFVFGGRGPFGAFAGRGAGPGGGRSALGILKERYARGELTREQLEQLRRDIE